MCETGNGSKCDVMDICVIHEACYIIEKKIRACR